MADSENPPPAEQNASPAPATNKKKRKNRKKKRANADNAETAAPAPAPAAEQPAEAEAAATEPAVASGEAEAVEQVSPQEAAERDRQIRQMMQLLQMRAPAAAGGAREHKFWDTQPVPSTNTSAQELAEADHGPLETKTVDEVRPTPYNMPRGFSWVNVDLQVDGELDELYVLLSENYVEDDEAMFRFDYSREFLRWALLPPGYNPDLHIGVRRDSDNALMAFISGIPAEMRAYDSSMPMVEINFLCAHKTLRDKRLAPVLIREVTRRVNLTNVWQAVYTAGVVLPRPVARCQYYHRSLNPKKLVAVGFSALKQRMTLSRTIKLYRVPAQPLHAFRPLEAADVPGAYALLTTYLRNFKLAPQFTEDEFGHWFTPRDGVVHAYVCGDPVTDMVSFYSLPSSIMRHERYRTLFAAYSFYNVATSMSLTEAMLDALVLAKAANFDVFNALDVMENSQFLEELKFGPGDGHLQYYLYNWRCPEMAARDVGLVLM